MKNLILLFIIIFSGISLCKAQDTIVKKNGDLLKVKVTEIGTEEIKFKSFGIQDSPVIVLKKSEVKKVVVSGQVIINEKDEALGLPKTEDILVKKDGTLLKINVIEIGITEVKFKLYADQNGPTINVAKSEIKTLKVGEQLVIENKKETEDLILKKDGSSLKVKVIEMGSEDVKFKLYDAPDGPVMSLKKKDIKTIKINEQIAYEFKEDPYSSSNSSILNKTSSAKFHFFSPLFNHLAFTYEWMNKPSFNFELGFGIIGVGVSAKNSNSNITYGVVKNNATGFYLRGGPKFLLGSSSDIEVDGAKISHPLKGRYFQIQAILQTLNRSYSMDTGNVYNAYGYGYGKGRVNWEKTYQSLFLNLIYGRQNIYGKAITIGYYVGLGYGLETESTTGTVPNFGYFNQSFDAQRYTVYYFGRNLPVTFTGGFTIGYIHKPYESKANRYRLKENHK
ncbi:MAG: hypothetical protein V4667_04985 [Bacteroidota bacterium]